jgi:hypothetical protein
VRNIFFDIDPDYPTLNQLDSGRYPLEIPIIQSCFHKIPTKFPLKFSSCTVVLFSINH